MHYEANWKSLDARPTPDWFDNGKFGIFIHWGIFSVPSIDFDQNNHSEWFWSYWQEYKKPKYVEFMKKHYKPGFSYADFGPQFTCELFEPDQWADIFKHAGAKYIVLTSKHHEGFTLWPSNYSWNWNAMDVGAHRDLVGDLKAAIKKVGGIRFGMYFSQYEWFNPLLIQDLKKKLATKNYANLVSYPQMIEFVNTYKPELIWSDGDWSASDDYWRSKEFLQWLFNESPVKDSIAVNDRWGAGTWGHHGGYWNVIDHYDPGHLVAHKWENCFNLDRFSWGYRRTMTSSDVRTVLELINELARTIACGGNLLLNIGPTADGRIVAAFELRLRQLGRWLQTNGEAVYGTKPWIYQNNSNIWYTSRMRLDRKLKPDRIFNPQVEKNTIVYAFVMQWPHYGHLILPSVKATSKTKAQMLGHNHHITVAPHEGGGVKLDIGALDWHSLPSFDAWVIKLEYLETERRNPVKELIKQGLLDENGRPNNIDYLD
uniref:Putative alpha-L-fucosidase n=1 Tax=Plectus sambesii TaxID=2011161 RepID=A0A914WVT7_9BILA